MLLNSTTNNVNVGFLFLVKCQRQSLFVIYPSYCSLVHPQIEDHCLDIQVEESFTTPMYKVTDISDINMVFISNAM